MDSSSWKRPVSFSYHRERVECDMSSVPDWACVALFSVSGKLLFAGSNMGAWLYGNEVLNELAAAFNRTISPECPWICGGLIVEVLPERGGVR